jgi:hypothetical protein
MTDAGFALHPPLTSAREAMRHASGQAVILACMARLSLDAQQDMIDHLQRNVNRARLAQMKGQNT